MLVFSAHTPGPYEIEAARLERSLDAVGMRYDIATLMDRGSWRANLYGKAAHLAQTRRNTRGPLLWVDADAIVHRDVSRDFDDVEADVGFHYHRGEELLSGTIWMADTPRCIELFERVERLMSVALAAGDPIPDQVAIAQVVPLVAGLAVYRMPARYTFIFDLTARYSDDEPVIEHLQASRDYREGARRSSLWQRRQDKLAELGEGVAS